MGLFKKKEPKKVYLQTSATGDKETEEARLKALEASLEFLNKPQKKETKETTAEQSDPESGNTVDRNGQVGKTTAISKKNDDGTLQSPKVKPNPVAPAVQPSDRILHSTGSNTLNSLNAFNANKLNSLSEKNETSSDVKADAEAAEENIENKEKKPEVIASPKASEAAPADTQINSASGKPWGRRMDYRTAVVKANTEPQTSEPAVKPIAPKAVSNVPPAPHMPQNINSKAPMPPQAPAKTIVPTFPVVPDKANKPTVSSGKEPIPATIANAATIVAAGSSIVMPAAVPAPAEETPQESVKQEASNVQKAIEMPNSNVQDAPEIQEDVEKKFTTKKTEETVKQQKTAMIKNPLPTPKKHIPKEMDFDYQPISSQMHFDIVDMTGIDFFDIN